MLWSITKRRVASTHFRYQSWSFYKSLLHTCSYMYIMFSTIPNHWHTIFLIWGPGYPPPYLVWLFSFLPYPSSPPALLSPSPPLLSSSPPLLLLSSSPPFLFILSFYLIFPPPLPSFLLPSSLAFLFFSLLLSPNLFTLPPPLPGSIE